MDSLLVMKKVGFKSQKLQTLALWLFSLMVPLLAIILTQQGQLDFTTPHEDLRSYRLLPTVMAMFLMASGSYLSWIFSKRGWLLTMGWCWLVIAGGATAGLLIGRGWETHHVLEQGHWSITNLYEVSLLLLVMVAAIACWLDKKRNSTLGVFLSPLILAGVFFVLWLASIGNANPEHLVPSLKSYWLPYHVLANFIGYGAFTVAAAAGLMHLWRWRQDKLGKPSLLPTQEVSEQLGFRAVVVGFPIFTLAVVLGSLWAYEAWGGYWSWDPKETWALIVWLVYAGYLHTRMNRRKPDVVLAIWLVVGFIVTMFCYLGVNMFLSGLHSYGSLN